MTNETASEEDNRRRQQQKRAVEEANTMEDNTSRLEHNQLFFGNYFSVDKASMFCQNGKSVNDVS
jgi:hypothetical protein